MPTWITTTFATIRANIFLISVVAAFGAGFYIAWDWKGSRDGDAQKQAVIDAVAERDKEFAADQAKSAARDKATQEKLTAQENTVRDLKRRLKNETKNAVYSDCHLTPDGVRAINDTIDAFEGQPAGK